MEFTCFQCEEMLYEDSYGSYGDFSSVSENAIEQARRNLTADACPCLYCIRINIQIERQRNEAEISNLIEERKESAPVRSLELELVSSRP